MKNFLVLITCIFAFNYFLNAQNFALDLDGVNDKLGVSDAPELNPTGALSVEMWIKIDVWGSSVSSSTLIGKQATSPDRGYAFTVGQSGKVEFSVSINNAWVAATSPSVMGINQWYHVAGVYDGNTVKVYINGILQATNVTTGTHNTSTGTAMFLGDNPTWTGRLINGQIDEVRIWNVARTQAEILTNYIQELTGSETGLVAYWNFNQGTGTTATDISPNGNNATLLNMDAATDWVQGFIVPVNDIGVIGIASPSMIGPGFTNAETIKIEIKNYTSSNISNFDVSYKINGGTVKTETANVTINAFETYVYTFSGTEDLSSLSSYTFKAWTTKSGDNSNINDTITKTIQQIESTLLFDHVQHNFGAAGQTHIAPIYMPENFDNYSQILLHVNLTCPAGGCDPWDQAAQINILKNGNRFEIARYITPFGVACGGWTFDITDFKSMLTGSTIFESYVQVWGASGWLVNVQLELIPGIPAYQYSQAIPLWNNNYLVYGDPGISYDLPAQTINIPSATQDLKVRITSTGHGQANTDNAAEFKNITNYLWLDGVQDAAHVLWKTDCATNSCSPQSGTYTYSRAGWCPGQDVQPNTFNLAGKYTAGQNLIIDYVLQNYTNLLNTGYNNGSHTEPFLRIHAYLIEQGNSPLTNSNVINSEINNIYIYPNPAADYLTISYPKENKNNRVQIMNTTGEIVFENNNFNGETINTKLLSNGIYLLKYSNANSFSIKKFIVNH